MKRALITGLAALFAGTAAIAASDLAETQPQAKDGTTEADDAARGAGDIEHEVTGTARGDITRNIDDGTTVEVETNVEPLGADGRVEEGVDLGDRAADFEEPAGATTTQ